jgi:hypothetical protein
VSVPIRLSLSLLSAWLCVYAAVVISMFTFSLGGNNGNR